MRKLFNFFILLSVVFVLLISALQLYIFYLTKQLPWQKPVMDNVVPKDPGTVGHFGVLVFSKTNGYRHQSIETGILAIINAGKQRKWDVRTTENGAFFNDDYLRRFKVVIFLSTTGDILTPLQQKAFENWVENGGGYVGIHSATDTEHDWPWYDQLLGTHFRNHLLYPKQLPEAELITENFTHPSTIHLPARWHKADEWYNFKKNVRNTGDSIHVLVSLNEASYKVYWPTSVFYQPAKMNGDHPISWTNVVGKGRMFYTALGHTPETFADHYAMPHIIGGIEWAGRVSP